jgi:hypothetical protein
MVLKEPQSGGEDLSARIAALSSEHLIQDLLTLRLNGMKAGFIASGACGPLRDMKGRDWDALSSHEQQAAVAEYSRIMSHEHLERDPRFKAYHDAYSSRRKADIMGVMTAQTEVTRRMTEGMRPMDLDRHIILASTPIIGSPGTAELMNQVLALARAQLPDVK